jgi:CRP-like cAMP-binding protein
VFRNLDKLAKLFEVEPGNEYRIGNYSVEPALVNHYAGPLGYFISDDKNEFLFSSDTGPTQDVWVRFKQRTNCGLLITEVSFPNSLDGVAKASRHLTPALLKTELEKAFAQDRFVYLYHFKPGYLDLLFQELTEITNFDLHLLKMGMELEVHDFARKDHTPLRVRPEPPSGKVPRFDFSKDMYEQRKAMDRDFGLSFEPSEIIFEEGAPGKHMYIIQEGTVEVFRIVLGKKKSLSVLGPGDVFGEMSLLVNQTRTATVRALTRVRAYAFDRGSFEQMVHQNYGVAIKIIRMLALRLQEADIHIENLLYQDNESKLLNTIIRAVEDEGIKTKYGFLLRLTPEQLAIRTDLPVEELKKLLSKIMRAGGMSFKDGLFKIPDLDQLKKFLEYLETKEKYEGGENPAV